MTDAPWLCLYHADCADGAVAAWAVYRALGSDVEFLASRYEEPPPLETARGRHVLIVDFSYPRAALDALAAVATSVLVLDHHATARDALAGLPEPAPWSSWKLQRGEPGWPPHALFDMDRSGAGLTWDYLHADAPRPLLVTLTEDRDLWRFAHGDLSRHLHAWLMSFWDGASQVNLVILDTVALEGAFWNDALADGKAIRRALLRDVRGVVDRGARVMPLPDDSDAVPCCNAPGAWASEVCHEMITRYPEAPFVFTYYDAAARRHYSLRSGPRGAHVGRLAARYGGGGHAHAAGFTVPLP